MAGRQALADPLEVHLLARLELAAMAAAAAAM